MQPIDREGHETVFFYLSCRTLKNTDVLSKSDPQITVYVENQPVGQTEVIKDNLNPDFTTAIKVKYVFERKQPVKFVIQDIDKKGETDDLGTVETSMGNIMGSSNQTALYRIQLKGKDSGTLIVRTEIEPKKTKNKGKEDGGEVQIRTMISIQISAKLNPVKGGGCCSSSVPSAKFELARILAGDGTSSQIKVKQSEVIKSLTPQFATFEMPFQQFCGSDKSMPVDCTIQNGSKSLGKCQFTVKEIEEVKGSSKEYTLSDEAGVVIIGVLDIKDKEVRTEVPMPKNMKIDIRDWPHSFLEYIRGGIQINVSIAIDFTASNGSLHNTNPNQDNEYQKAMRSVCEIVLEYDSDKKVPLYGFGGSFPRDKHCYPLNEDSNDPEVYNLNGIMDTYEKAVKKYSLSAPTNMGDILKETNSQASEVKKKKKKVYQILLILTDGDITDMEITKQRIVEGSSLPLSIIIVGVGNASFGKMNELDADDGFLKDSHGKEASRDIVQFVPFKQFAGNKEKLAENVLGELPRQLLEYMVKNKIKPDQSKKVSVDDIMKNRQPNPNLQSEMGPGANMMNRA